MPQKHPPRHPGHRPEWSQAVQHRRHPGRTLPPDRQACRTTLSVRGLRHRRHHPRGHRRGRGGAFHAGNLKAVAKVLREAHPGAELVVCADDDRHTEGNPGVARARAAAATVGGLVLVPRFRAMTSFL
jgi:hypothetical protein